MSEMNIRGKLFQQTVLERISDNLSGGCNSTPLIVELDTTEVCDLACPGCVSEDLIAQGNSFTSERLLQLGKEIHAIGVKGVVLIGGGEPLAHPAVGELMEFFGDNGVSLGITTNGTLIHRYHDVIAKHSSWTRVSVDAASEEMFLQLRPTTTGKSKFSTIIDNMRKLAKDKKGKLGFSFLVRTAADGFGIGSNISEIYDAAKLAKEIGCDYFELKPSYQYANGMDHLLVVHEQDEMDKARTEIKKIYCLETDNFKIMEAINLKYSLDCENKPQHKNYTNCPSAEMRTLISPSGVYVCPYFRDKGEQRVGNASNTSFKDIWFGSGRSNVMGKLNPSIDCPMHCLRHESNLELLNIEEKMKNGRGINPVKDYDMFI